MTRGAIGVAVGSLCLVAAGCSLSGKGSSTTTTTTIRVVTVAPTPATAVATTPPAAETSTPPSAATSTSTSAPSGSGRVVSSPSDSVKLGDSGAGVRTIQQALVAWGYSVAVDGQFGKQTDGAVRRFQADHGLKQDGIVGPVTWKKLGSTPPASATSAPAKAGTTTTANRATTTTTA